MAFFGKSLSSQEQVYFEQLKLFIQLHTSQEIACSPFLFTHRAIVTEAMIRFELFKLVQNTAGSFVECGTSSGNNLMLLAHISALVEPYAIARKIIGFDSFEGFCSVDHQYDPERVKDGDMNVASLDTLCNSIALYDQNRVMGHMDKIEIVKGNACETIPKYLQDHPSLVIALLYLDFDIYQPTKTALENLLSRVVKNGIVAFDEFNYEKFSGETRAALDCLSMNQVQVQRFPWAPFLGYFRV